MNKNELKDQLTFKILTCDTPDLNNVTYPREEVEKAVAKYQEKIKNGTALGIVGESGQFPRRIDSLSINLDRVSHIVTEMHVEDNNVLATIKVLDTPHGKILKELLDCEVNIHLVSSSIEITDKDGVVSNLTLTHTKMILAADTPTSPTLAPGEENEEK